MPLERHRLKIYNTKFVAGKHFLKWKKNISLNILSQSYTRHRFIIIEKQTNYKKVKKQISRNSFEDNRVQSYSTTYLQGKRKRY